MTVTRYGVQTYDIEIYFSADDIYNMVVDAFGEEGAKYIVSVAEMDDFDIFKQTLASLGLPNIDYERFRSRNRQESKVFFPAIVNAILCMRYPFLQETFLSKDQTDDQTGLNFAINNQFIASGLVIAGKNAKAIETLKNTKITAENDGDEKQQMLAKRRYDISFFEASHYIDIPYGWAKTFGLELCEDIRSVLLGMRTPDHIPTQSEISAFESYSLAQIKEKFGSLRWYGDCNCGKTTRKYLMYLLTLYEEISSATCIECGNIDDVYLSRGGWISPFCMTCSQSRLDREQIINFAKQLGGEDTWKYKGLSELVTTYLVKESSPSLHVDITEATTTDYSKGYDNKKIINIYDRLYKRFPNLHIFEFADKYKNNYISEEVTLSQMRELIENSGK